MNKTYKIGTRGSELALWQANWVKEKLEKNNKGTSFEIEIIRTTGDKVTGVSLSKIGDKGLFTREIEQALIDGAIDMAVHSLKDLPTVLPDGLKIGCCCERIEQRDVFISHDFVTLNDIPQSGKVATGSLRRRSQLLNYRSDLQIIDIRGNITTRLNKFKKSDWAGIILAYAGISRLGLDDYIKQIIPVDIIFPAVSQGIVGVEIRSDDNETLKLAAAINDEKAEIESRAERAFLKELEGGCQVPIGVYSAINDEVLILRGMVGSVDGTSIIRDKFHGSKYKPEETGYQLAAKLKKQGAMEILKSIRNY